MPYGQFNRANQSPLKSRWEKEDAGPACGLDTGVAGGKKPRDSCRAREISTATEKLGMEMPSCNMNSLRGRKGKLKANDL